MNQVDNKPKLTEDERIKGIQLELFPEADTEEIERACFWLKKYVEMQMLIRDFELYEADLLQTDAEGETARKESNEEYYANKTANAVVLADKRRWIYREYKDITTKIQRAWSMIIDRDAKTAIECRYLKGYTYAETVKFFKSDISDRTIDRKLAIGIKTVAEMLKLYGVLDRELNY